jgi:hypothetical protein
MLKPSGRLLLTVPFGKHGVAEWYRVYDHEALLNRLKTAGFRVEVEDFWSKKDDVRWVPTPWKEAERLDSISTGARAVACIVARPLAR